MSITATLTSNLTVVETIAGVLADATGTKTTYSGENEIVSYTGATVPAGTLTAAFEQALTSGAATIDLTNLVGTNGAVVNGNGLKVRAVKFKNKTGNANPITVTFGASNGHLLLGTGWKFILAPGQSILLNLADGGPAIGSSSKTIDLAGTGSQILQVDLVIG